MSTLKEKMDDMIRKHGFMVQGVYPAKPGDRSFAYTIGLAAKGLPEVIVIGLPWAASSVILNTVAKRLIEKGSLPIRTPLEEVMIGGRCMLMETDKVKTDEYMFGASARYPDYTALQLVWTDERGRFPWQRGFPKRFHAMQPLLSPTVQ